MDDLVRRAIDVNHQLLALGNETFEAAAGIFVRNRGVRHRGLATALIHHCVAGCRKHGAGPVLIVARSDDSPKNMYRALGLRPLCPKRNYSSSVPLSNRNRPQFSHKGTRTGPVALL